VQRATYPPSKIFGVCIATSEGLRNVAPMAANGSGLQWSTIRNVISGALYFVFYHLF